MMTVKMLERMMRNKDEIMEYRTYLLWQILNTMSAIVKLVLLKTN